MTKTVDLVTLYYKGHSPFKKQDNSYLMCLYTMLFVLFAMMIILLLFTFYDVDPAEREVPKPQPLQVTQRTTTQKPKTTSKTTYEELNGFYEETAAPLVDWNQVKDFFFGEDSESTTLVETVTSSVTHKSQPTPIVNNNVALNQEHNQSVHNYLQAETQPPSNTTESIPKNNDSEPVQKEINFLEWQEPAPTPSDKESEWISSLQHKKSARLEVQKDCESARCKTAASGMLSLMDLSVEPCRDFYSFACGGNTHVSKTEPQILPLGVTAEVNFVQKISTFFDSCIDHQVRMNYRDRIRATRKVLGSDFEQHSSDLTEVFATLVLSDAMPFFNIDVDVHNSSFVFKLLPPEKALSSKYWSPMKEIRKNCLTAIQPDNYGPTIDITFLYYDYEKCQRYNDYLKSLETAMEELGHLGSLSSEQREKYIAETVSFVLKHIIPIFEEIPSVSSLEDKLANSESVQMDTKDLQKLFPLINWSKLFEQLQTNQVFKVIVFDMEYFENLSKNLSKIERSKMVVALMAILTENYYQELVLPTPRPSREKFCDNLSQKLFPDISNYLLRKTVVPEVFSKQQTYISNVFENMKQNFQSVLKNEQWLDDISKNSMMEKLNKIKLETSDGFNEITGYLDKLYSGLNLKAKDFSFNYKETVRFRRKNLFGLQGNPVTNKNIFWNFISDVQDKPVFFYGHNIVYIPDKIVRKTYLDLPNYLIMAKIGFPLAKVIGHMFDPIGIHFDTNLSENVTSIYKNFVQETQRTLPHYMDFNKMNLVFSLNNRLSTVERFAENTAMALLTNSIEDIQHQALIPLVSFTFSREKIFFMALVQEFCEDLSLMEFVVQSHESAVLPAQFRVQNILKNSEAFHMQFSCRPVTKTPYLQFPYLSVLLEKDNDKIT